MSPGIEYKRLEVQVFILSLLCVQETVNLKTRISSVAEKKQNYVSSVQKLKEVNASALGVHLH